MTTAFQMPASWYEPPTEHEATDDPGTACLGSYPADATTDAYECDQRVQCSGCGGVVCKDHDDDVADCSEGPAHAQCHDQGCSSLGCAQDRYDDMLLERAEANRDER